MNPGKNHRHHPQRPRGARHARLQRPAPPRVGLAHETRSCSKRWLFGPDGWSLEVCTVDLRVGGKARYRNGEAGRRDAGWDGAIPSSRSSRQERLVSRQLLRRRLDAGRDHRNAGAPPKRSAKTLLETDGSVRLEGSTRRAINTGMVHGMEMGYARLDKIFEELVASGK